MSNDILVVGEEKVVRQLLPLEQSQSEGQVKVRDVVLVQSFQMGALEVAGQLLEASDTKEPKHPLVQHQALVKLQRFRRCGHRTAAGRCEGYRSWHAVPQTSCTSNIRRANSSSIRRTFQASSSFLRFSRLLS